MNHQDYRSSHVKSERGMVYDDNFLTHAWRAYLWEREKHILRKLFSNIDARNSHLDFACGTGRILEYLQQFVITSTGVDISESMLEVCRKRIKRARIIKADITRENILYGEQFDIITAFRFFSNAQKSLRFEAMQAISGLLKENGIIVFNNHKNSTNGFYLLSKLFGRNKVTMSKSEVHDLVSDCGLKVVMTFPIGALPSHERYMLLPRWVSSVIDWLVCVMQFGETLCQNVIYVCKKI